MPLYLPFPFLSSSKLVTSNQFLLLRLYKGYTWWASASHPSVEGYVSVVTNRFNVTEFYRIKIIHPAGISITDGEWRSMRSRLHCGNIHNLVTNECVERTVFKSE